MANEEQLSILKQDVEVWNEWRKNNVNVLIDLRNADLSYEFLMGADLRFAHLVRANLSGSHLGESNLFRADLRGANLSGANLEGASLMKADLMSADLTDAYLGYVDFHGTDLREASLSRSNFTEARLSDTIFGYSDLREAIGLMNITHNGPSSIAIDVFSFSKGEIPEVFLRGCGLSDADIEYSKLSNPDLSNEERNRILYKVYDLQASQAIQISPLFISYSHINSPFVDKLESLLNKKGIRFWRDIHDMKSGRMENQIDRAIRQNPTLLLILSENSLNSDWVEHEVRTARELEKETGRDVLCPLALDDSWKSSPWPKRVMEQVMEYNILDFSEWEDDGKFESVFRRLIDGLELFYKG